MTEVAYKNRIRKLLIEMKEYQAERIGALLAQSEICPDSPRVYQELFDEVLSAIPISHPNDNSNILTRKLEGVLGDYSFKYEKRRVLPLYESVAVVRHNDLDDREVRVIAIDRGLGIARHMMKVLVFNASLDQVSSQPDEAYTFWRGRRME
jgi:hypothetical protein